MNKGTLHLYAQPFTHAEAWICGTREALIELRDAIDKALTTESPVALTSFANDGEGYVLLVCPMAEADVSKLVEPYAHSDGARGDGLSPYDAIGLDNYRRLVRGAWK